MSAEIKDSVAATSNPAKPLVEGTGIKIVQPGSGDAEC